MNILKIHHLTYVVCSPKSIIMLHAMISILAFMLSTQANQFIENKIVDTNTVIRLLKYNVTAVNNNK